jgi:YVTN family beta-propeller protein
MARQSRRVLAALLGALGCTVALAASPVGTAAASTASPGPVAWRPIARPGTDLLLNPGAQAGAFSVRGWDAVTIPGWQIAAGLPTVVRYGTRHFPQVTGKEPAVRGGQLFAGGAGGTALLRQVVRLRPAAGRWLPRRTRFRLSAWLGGGATSAASVKATFLSRADRVLGRRVIGPVGMRRPEVFSRRAATGSLPRGTSSVVVTLVLATSLKNIDGPNAPYTGYDYGAADDLSFSVSAPVRPARLAPPAARIPRYQHVFLFYFENEDFSSVIGNTAQAPFLNSLLPHASLLSDFFAEEHPSDGNYLALAGGSTFGIPLDDPAEENPQYTIRARNIGDLVDYAHESWKAYLQSADGPCDDTVHRYYWDDDMPMMYFADVRNRPAYCAAHVVPLQALQTDLATARTTPSFAWVSPNDCSDMEGCGIRAGDEFLAAELGAIMRSPAWRTQRSLAIITFDEDGYDHEHPAQRVPTVVIGSRGVRQGFVSHVRYTHYSLLRTIEAALGLGTLTANDRYAQPLNDVFADPAKATAGWQAAGSGSSRWRVSSARPAPTTRPAPTARLAVLPPAAPARRGDPTAFVVNSGSDSVTPIDLATRQAGRPIRVGRDPEAIAVAPGGKTGYVVNEGSGTVTPIDLATQRAETPILVGRDPQAIAIAPNGKAAYVVNEGSGTVTPIDLATQRAETPIPVGRDPQAIAIAPNGRTALVLDWGSASVTPIRIGSADGGRPAGRAGRPIRVGSYPFAVSIGPGGRIAYVASYGADTVTPIDVGAARAGRPIRVGQAPNALAITPDGGTVYVVDGDSEAVTPISGITGHTGRLIKVGYSPTAIAVSGGTAYVVNTISGTVTPVSVRSGLAGRAINVGIYNYPTAIAVHGNTAVVVGTYGGQVTLVNTRTRRPIATIAVGEYPVALAIAG